MSQHHVLGMTSQVAVAIRTKSRCDKLSLEVPAVRCIFSWLLLLGNIDGRRCFPRLETPPLRESGGAGYQQSSQQTVLKRLSKY